MVTAVSETEVAVSALVSVRDRMIQAYEEIMPDADFDGRTRRGSAMTGPEVLDVARDSIMTLVLVSSPILLIGLLVGVVISLFQALTQIQEMTLVFVPKILAIFIALLIALPFMADLLNSHMMRLAARIAAG